jgi:hypothetical protein
MKVLIPANLGCCWGEIGLPSVISGILSIYNHRCPYIHIFLHVRQPQKKAASLKRAQSLRIDFSVINTTKRCIKKHTKYCTKIVKKGRKIVKVLLLFSISIMNHPAASDGVSVGKF